MLNYLWDCVNEYCEEHICNTVFSTELVCAAITKVVCGFVLSRAEMVNFPSI